MAINDQNVLQKEYLHLVQEGIQTGIIKIEEQDAQYVNTIERRFPFFGSKIDWDEIPSSLFFDLTSLKNNKNAHNSMLKEGFKTIYQTVLEMGLNEDQEIIIVGDSIFDIALRMPLGKLPELYWELFELPQHTYIIPPDASWCINFTFEHELFFGVAPN